MGAISNDEPRSSPGSYHVPMENPKNSQHSGTEESFTNPSTKLHQSKASRGTPSYIKTSAQKEKDLLATRARRIEDADHKIIRLELRIKAGKKKAAIRLLRAKGWIPLTRRERKAGAKRRHLRDKSTRPELAHPQPVVELPEKKGPVGFITQQLLCAQSDQPADSKATSFPYSDNASPADDNQLRLFPES